MHLVLMDLDEHEREIFVERLRGQWRILFYVARPYLSARTGDEVRDTVLWLYSLIEMIVAGKDHIDRRT